MGDIAVLMLLITAAGAAIRGLKKKTRAGCTGNCAFCGACGKREKDLPEADPFCSDTEGG